EAAVAIGAPQRLQRRHLGRARRAPRGPEVQHDDLASPGVERRVAAAPTGEPEARATLAFLEFGHAGALEDVGDPCPVAVAVTTVLAGAAPGQAPQQCAQQRQRERELHQAPAPGQGERVRGPALHTPSFSRVIALSRSSWAGPSKTIAPFSMM